jgi:16S rRNA (guanine527-N7)-methyltransferase
MENLFVNCGIDINITQKEKFNRYFELLVYYNQKFNITAITEKEEVYKKHFIDSILGLDYIDCGKVIDIGAGGGFPSLPLKIMNNSLNMTLLEATGKKCEFLKTVVKELELENVEVINGRAEDFAKDINFRENFDFAVARAVARLNTLSEYCLPFVKIGGKFVAYKGSDKEEIVEAENAIKILGGKLDKVINKKLFDAERNIIVINKIKSTEKKYPRGNGKERKNPL